MSVDSVEKERTEGAGQRTAENKKLFNNLNHFNNQEKKESVFIYEITNLLTF